MMQLSLAEKLLQSVGITKPAEIDLELIAWHCGAEVTYRELDGCEAKIIGFGDCPAPIYVSSLNFVALR